MWELLSFMQGKVRKQVLEALEKGPKTPSNLAESSQEHLSHISRALKELTERGLVDCMTPELFKNKIFQITDKGRVVLRELERMNK
jgi:predicted transcriptional regulator